jgi:hypothetical protein
MSALHRSTVHGLEVASEIELPELLPSVDPDCAPDVVVRRGTVPLRADDPDDRWFIVRADGTAIVRIDDVATFAVRSGAEIVVDAVVGADPAAMRVYLLGTALGTLLHQRGDLPLHVSAVVIDGRAWAFTGPQGAGKSTLAAALHLHAGLPLVTDDVGVVRPGSDGSGEAWLWPGPALLKLRPDAHDGVRGVAPPALPEYAGSEKVRLSTRDGSVRGPVPIAGIVLLHRSGAGEDTAPSPASGLERVSGAEAFLVAQSSVYRLPQGTSVAGLNEAFGRVARVANTVPTYIATTASTGDPASSGRALDMLGAIRTLAVSAPAGT